MAAEDRTTDIASGGPAAADRVEKFEYSTREFLHGIGASETCHWQDDDPASNHRTWPGKLRRELLSDPRVRRRHDLDASPGSAVPVDEHPANIAIVKIDSGLVAQSG